MCLVPLVPKGNFLWRRKGGSLASSNNSSRETMTLLGLCIPHWRRLLLDYWFTAQNGRNISSVKLINPSLAFYENGLVIYDYCNGLLRSNTWPLPPTRCLSGARTPGMRSFVSVGRVKSKVPANRQRQQQKSFYSSVKVRILVWKPTLVKVQIKIVLFCLSKSQKYRFWNAL